MGVRHGVGAGGFRAMVPDAPRAARRGALVDTMRTSGSGRIVMDTAAPASPAASPQPSKIRGVVLALLVNAVPLAGVLWFDWSALNVLVLYWVENVLIAIGTSIRIAVHRALTRKQGYARASNRLGIKVDDKPVTSGLLTEYMIAAFGFTAAHGVFVVGIVFILRQNFPDTPMWRFSFEQVWHGALAIAVMLAVELVVDLTRIRSVSFAAMTDYARSRMTRVFVLHMTLIIGLFAMGLTNSPMGILYVLIALKTLVDVAGALRPPSPSAETADDEASKTERSR
jgi:cytochrome b561